MSIIPTLLVEVVVWRRALRVDFGELGQEDGMNEFDDMDGDVARVGSQSDEPRWDNLRSRSNAGSGLA